MKKSLCFSFRLTLSLAKSRLPRIYRGCRLSGPRAIRLTVFFLSLSPLLLVSPSVVHAQWEPDVRLTFDPDSSCLSNNGRCLAVSGDTVQVVWFDRRDGNWEIYYKRSLDAGNSWSQDTRLTSDPASSQNPSIAVSGSTIHLVWQDSRDGNGEIYYKNSTDGGVVWSPDTRLTADTSASSSPCIAVSGAVVHVVWWDNRTGAKKIYYKRSPDGGSSWSPDLCLTFGISGGHEYPCITSAGDIICLAYHTDYQTNYAQSVYFKRSLDGGASWFTDTALAIGYWGVFSWNSNSYPSITLVGLNAYLVWRYFFNDQRYPQFNWTAINYRSSQDGGSSWSPCSSLTRGSCGGNTFGSPSIWAISPNVHAVWTTPPGYPNEEVTWRTSSDNGTNWQPEIRLTNDPARSINSFIAVQNTKVHVVWQDNRAGNYEIYYKRNLTGNAVEENKSPSPVSYISYSVRPNPFTSFAAIPGHSSELFALFDISGQKVGVYKGDRVGEGLGPGVYFVRGQTSTSTPLRIVKIR